MVLKDFFRIIKNKLIELSNKKNTNKDGYKDKDEIQHWRTEIIASVITPLAWKTRDDKKENGSTDKVNTNVAEPEQEEDLPF